MSDDKNDLEGSDWLSSQFNPTEQVPQQPAPAATTPSPAPAPAAPQAPGGDSAFDWLLQQAPADAAPAVPPEPPQFVPPPLVQPPAPEPAATVPSYATPTTPFTPFPGEPTRPLSWDEFAATQQPSPQAPPAQPASPAFADEPTQAFTVPPWQPAPAHPVYPSAPVEPVPPLDQSGEPTSALDSLFGDHQFQSYEEVGVLASVQAGPGSEPSAPKPPREPLSRLQKTLMGVAGGLIAVLVLLAMYFLGQHIGSSQAAAAALANSKSNSTRAPKSAGTGGPASPGVQPWTALQGGECLNPFTSAWAATFTVVPCTSDHVAEMVFKGTLPDASGSGYPTTAQFQTEITGLCSAPTAINYANAKSITDLQVSFSYPPTVSKWLAGDRTYYCFVDRQSGGNLQGDLTVPQSGN